MPVFCLIICQNRGSPKAWLVLSGSLVFSLVSLGPLGSSLVLFVVLHWFSFGFSFEKSYQRQFFV